MTHRDNILKLRSEGKSYREIVEILGCSKGTISFHCGEGQKEKTYNRNIKHKTTQNPLERKLQTWNINSIIGQKKIENIEFKFRKTIYNRLYGFNNRASNNMLTIEEVLQKIGDNPKCYLTGRPININKPRTYQFDHIIPRSKGGKNDIENFNITCKEANMAKFDCTLPEFIQLCKEVLENFGYEIIKK